MTMSARRALALHNMARYGSGPEAATAAKKLGSPMMRNPITMGARSEPARVMGAIGTGKASTYARTAGSGAKRHLPAVIPKAPLEKIEQKAAAQTEKSVRLFKNPKQAAMIGLGLGVAATVAMNRRGQGASSGRQSMYRY